MSVHCSVAATNINLGSPRLRIVVFLFVFFLKAYCGVRTTHENLINMQIPGPGPSGVLEPVLTSSAKSCTSLPSSVLAGSTLAAETGHGENTYTRKSANVGKSFFFFLQERAGCKLLPAPNLLESELWGEGPQAPAGLLSCRPGDSAALRMFCNHHHPETLSGPASKPASS